MQHDKMTANDCRYDRKEHTINKMFQNINKKLKCIIIEPSSQEYWREWYWQSSIREICGNEFVKKVYLINKNFESSIKLSVD